MNDVRRTGFASILNAYRGVRVLVLGAGGFIGRWVCRLLSGSGAHLSLAVRQEAMARQVFRDFQVTGELLEIDLQDFSRVEQLLQQAQPAITFNLAGYGVDPMERDQRLSSVLNTELPAFSCQVLAGCRDRSWGGQAIVQAGTAAEYGRAGGDLHETTTALPTNPYGMSKLEGTRRFVESCRESQLAGLVVRLFTVYGPGEHAGRLLPSILQAASSGTVLQLTSGRQQRDFTYVQDAAEGLLRLGLVSTSPGQVVNLATGRLTPVKLFARQAADVLGLQADRLQFGALAERPDEMRHAPVNIQRLLSLTGWRPATSIKSGLRQTARFLEGPGEQVPATAWQR